MCVCVCVCVCVSHYSTDCKYVTKFTLVVKTIDTRCITVGSLLPTVTIPLSLKLYVHITCINIIQVFLENAPEGV